ncbi:MAG: MFS transporter [Bacteriovoracaceae bacterium]
MNSSMLLLLLTFISSIGDTIFLVGLPLHLYKSSDQSFTSTTIISILIYLTVFIFSKVIIKIHSIGNPIKTVAWGEITMGMIEILTLLIYNHQNSNVVLIISIIPLALVYNLYAVPKFYELQDYFCNGEVTKYTALMSFFREAGVFTGITAASFIIEYYSIKEALILDSISFLFYGIILLAYKSKSKNSHLKNQQTKPNSASNFEDLSLKNFLIISSISSFFLAWQQSSSIPVINNSFNISFDSIGLMRVIFGVTGLGIGILILNLNYSIKKFWIHTTLAVLIIVLISYLFDNYIIAVTVFVILGTLKSSNDAARKSYYVNCLNKGIYPKLASIQWTVESLTKMSLIPLAFVMDSFFKGNRYTLLIYLGFLLVCGALTGLLNYEYIRKKHYR